MKSGHVDFGKQGEEQAREFLVKKGYKILDANFSTKIGELDLIASKDGLLVIVEVKRRKNARHGYPREAVHLHNSGRSSASRNGIYKNINCITCRCVLM